LTALFLSAFHVTMLIAFIGAHLWIGRILGAMVGVFLIITGNELPRSRPSLLWGIRTPQRLGCDDVWRRVHRLGGYVRVLMGSVVCVTSLSGMLGFAELIVVAVGIETVVCLGAATFLSRQKTAAMSAVLLCCWGAGLADAQGLAPENIQSLPAFIDATVPKLMEQRHVAGTALVVVHEGQIIVSRGYGKARLDSGASVDPARTVFRIGSLTKVFTAAAAVQLAESGKLDLHRDIREFLPDIPLRYGATTHQLLTHTAGLDERFAGAYTDSPEHLQRLSDHLRRYTPEQVFRPGTASSYTNYGYALAGLVVERLSGLTYEQYMAERIFKPLRMTSTSARQPPEANLITDLARGYRWTVGGHEALPYTYTQGAPAGSMTTTAADMGRFMLAMLSDGSVGGERILSPESLATMLASQYTPDPRIPGTAYGFGHVVSHGQRLLVRGGTLGDQAALMVLAPAYKLGIVVASNALPGIGDFLFEPVMTHLAGPAVPAPAPTPLPDALQRASRFAGTYRAYRHARHEMSRIRALMPMMQPRVTVEPDGAIRWQGRRWLEVEPLVFRRVDSSEFMVFRENERGEVTGVGSYERIRWYEQTPFHMGILLLCVIAFLAYPLSRALRAIRRRRAIPEGKIARVCAVFVAMTNLTFLVGLVVFFREFGAITPLPLPIVLWLSLPLASVAVTALLPAFAAMAWNGKWWTRGERLWYSTFAVLAVAFMTFLNYWKLLGIRY
jgi:CubicO group peptidase (beta-lactamase class C family)